MTTTPEDRALDDLADQFRAAQLEHCESLRGTGDYPTRFAPAVAARTGEQAVDFTRRLIETAPYEGTVGFRRMVRRGRGHQTAEYQVLWPRWQPLFDHRTLAVADHRLRWAGIVHPNTVLDGTVPAAP